jgi:hypothetical protein
MEGVNGKEVQEKKRRKTGEGKEKGGKEKKG